MYTHGFGILSLLVVVVFNARCKCM